MSNILPITLAFLLLLLNGFFVAAEFGMVKLRHTRVQAIRQLYGFRGKILFEIHQHLDAYLSACQLGITLASLGLGWIGEPAFAKMLGPTLAYFGVLSSNLIHFLSFFIAFSFLSFLHIVIGELMPKSLAIRQAERVSLWTAVPLYIFYWIMFPAIWLLNATALLLLKLLHLDKTHPGEHSYSTDEMKLIFATSHLHGELSREEFEILEHTVEFADLEASDIMRPIEEMIMLNTDTPIDESLKIIFDTHYSRYPIFDNSLEEIIGVLHVKDLLPLLYKKDKLLNFNSIVRSVFKIKENLAAADLLRKFRSGKAHLAIVYSHMQIPVGFVTLDNLLHVLVGRIKDEFHRTKEDWDRMPDGGILMAGNCSSYALERALGYPVLTPEEKDIATLNGLIFHRLQAIPKPGETIEFDKFFVIVDEVKGPRILKARVYKKPGQDDV